MMSGCAAITSCDETMRSLALLQRARWCEHVDAAGRLDQLRDPADAGDHRVVPFLEIDPRPVRRASVDSYRIQRDALRQRNRIPRPRRPRRQCAERADHGENSGDIALVEGMHRDAAADQLGDDVRLQVGEREHQIGLERKIFPMSADDERRHPRLFAPHLGPV